MLFGIFPVFSAFFTTFPEIFQSPKTEPALHIRTSKDESKVPYVSLHIFEWDH